MPIFKDDGGKTEPATPRKREEARSKGSVALSRELTVAVLLLCGVFLLEVMGSGLTGSMRDAVVEALSLQTRGPFDPRSAAAFVEATARPVIPWVLGFMAVLVLTVLACDYGQIGFRISLERIGFRPERLNPKLGLSRLFHPTGFFKLGLSVAKVAVLGGVLYLVLRARKDELTALVDLSFTQSVAVIAKTLLSTFWWAAVAILLISFADLAYQRYRHEVGLRMTKQEVEDERKRTEGDPKVKSRIRRAQRELARRRMLHEVPKADVVITNPTHYAVALRYRRSAMAAPTVIAKGTDRLALRIREIATESRVPILEDPPLARALHAGADVGDEIPAALYRAVATVLSQVYRLKGRRPDA